MTRYDDVPYDDHPITLSHPDRLLAIGRLFAIPTVDASEARVLELGCGTGANLLPVAARYPGARCVGLDLHDAPMNRSRELAADLDLANLELRQHDLTESGDLGEHDVVLAHGLYSWMTPDGARTLLERVSGALAPSGVAFVSFATLPGARVRQGLRDVLWARVAGIAEAAEQVRVARELALVLATTPGRSEASRAMCTLAATVGGMSDAYLFHDLLSPEYHPALLSEVVSAASSAGLQYVCDAYLPASFPSDPSVIRALGPHAEHQVELETWLDAVAMRSFRQAVFVRRDTVVDRALSGVRLLELTLATEAVALGSDGGPEHRYRAADGTVFGSADPDVVRVLDRLVASPEPVPVRALRARPASLQALLGAVVSAQLEVGTIAHDAATSTPGPRGFPLAQAQARRGRRALTSLHHRDVEVSTDARRVLMLLDGTRTQEQLEAEAGFRVGVALAELERAGVLMP